MFVWDVKFRVNERLSDIWFNVNCTQKIRFRGMLLFCYFCDWFP